jgi:hypothetical protein
MKKPTKKTTTPTQTLATATLATVTGGRLPVRQPEPERV